MIITNPLVTGQCSAITCRRGIVRYMGPEQINPKDFGMPSSEALRETDVYSFAMTAYEVCPFFVRAHDIDRYHPPFIGPHRD